MEFLGPLSWLAGFLAIVGYALWNIFSNNTEDAELNDLRSWRAFRSIIIALVYLGVTLIIGGIVHYIKTH